MGTRERIQSALGGSGLRPVALATGLGAASSSCSYAAIAIAKSLFQKGASAASALVFVTMVAAALIVDGLFSAAGLIPETRPTNAEIFSPIAIGYTLFANILAAGIFAALFALSVRRAASGRETSEGHLANVHAHH